ncbi:TonB family protein [uncultured Selenomonas sp.]|mgnify:FL=1|uniref:TonB family protein n=1 Tax=uncultured Selenomonas sp. TaxID=159275 RepID=UPI0025F4F776|nr:TonB family protein [uncultured Selenomonas sp.]
MEQNLSWIKAYGVSILLHIVIALLFALGLAQVVAEKEQQTYVVDLATSDFSQGSGHEGGGGGGSLAAFPEPLKEEEMTKRVETVQQAQTFAAEAEAVTKPEAVQMPPPATTSASDATPAANTSSTAASAGSSAVSGGGDGSGSGTGSGSGSGSGDGTGSGSGSGDGTGSGHGTGNGSGNGQGSGDANVAGTGTAPFDESGFWAAVDANKEYPYMAIKRHLEGSASVGCTVTTGGSVVGVFLNASSGYDMLDDAAVAAVRAVGSYPNPTGHDVPITVPVRFNLN